MSDGTGKLWFVTAISVVTCLAGVVFAVYSNDASAGGRGGALAVPLWQAR